MKLWQTLPRKLVSILLPAVFILTIAVIGAGQGKRLSRIIPAAPLDKDAATKKLTSPANNSLYPFRDAGLPASTLAGVTPGPDGMLYGVTYDGGTSNNGTIYRTDPALSSVTVLHNFNGAGDGSVPYDELIFDPASSKFFGTTSRGGPSNFGTIFEFDPATNALTTLISDFGGYSQPQGLYVSSGNFIYGIAAHSNGAVFRLAKNGTGFTILHAFTDFSALPQALTLGSAGKLYGVTLYGGIICDPNYNGCGTIFRLNAVLPGNTNVQFQTLYQFNNPAGGENFPALRLIYGSDGLVYGTTHHRIFRIDPQNANPGSTIQFIWAGNGTVSLTIIEGADNRLYATSYSDNMTGAGGIFSLNKDGSNVTNLHDFSLTSGSTSYGPYGRLYRNAAGTVYGTTEYVNSPPYRGTVFSISTARPPTKLKITGGDILVSSPGKGIILKSPTTTSCKLLTIDNAGALILAAVPCP